MNVRSRRQAISTRKRRCVAALAAQAPSYSSLVRKLHSGSSGGAKSTFAFWDPYPQFDEGLGLGEAAGRLRHRGRA